MKDCLRYVQSKQLSESESTKSNDFRDSLPGLCYFFLVFFPPLFYCWHHYHCSHFSLPTFARLHPTLPSGHLDSVFRTSFQLILLDLTLWWEQIFGWRSGRFLFLSHWNNDQLLSVKQWVLLSHKAALLFNSRNREQWADYNPHFSSTLCF